MIDVLILDALDRWAWHLVLFALIASIGFALIFTTLRKKPDPLGYLHRYEVTKTPVLEEQFSTAEELMRYAYHKHRDQPFVVAGRWRKWETVILPPKIFDMIKSLPENELSFYDALDTRFLHHLTTIKVPWEGGDTPMLKALAIDLQRHLTNHLSDIADEADYAFDALLPNCEDDWVEVYPMQVLPRILALVSGRILVGLPLSRNPEPLDLKLGFFKNSFIAMYILGHMVPEPLRAIVAPLTPWVRNLKKAHAKMQQFIEPVIKAKKLAHEQGKETHSDLLEWVINNAPEHLKYNVPYQAHAQLITNVASIQSLYVASSHAWFDLAAHPECIDELREEWHGIMDSGKQEKQHKISLDDMTNKARKLDSFIKESARYNPSQLTALEYILRRDLHLPDGTLLPQGTYISTATSQMGRDATLWEDPDVFDAFRFQKLRSQPGNDGKFLFNSTGLDQLSFGYGRHPCPGRYYAGHVLKIMTAKLVDKYEVKLPDGQGRPKNVENWIALTPDDKVPILLRKRKGRAGGRGKIGKAWAPEVDV